jgi:hypothetical protein
LFPVTKEWDAKYACKNILIKESFSFMEWSSKQHPKIAKILLKEVK